MVAQRNTREDKAMCAFERRKCRFYVIEVADENQILELPIVLGFGWLLTCQQVSDM